MFLKLHHTPLSLLLYYVNFKFSFYAYINFCNLFLLIIRLKTCIQLKTFNLSSLKIIKAVNLVFLL
jgi:hypothetical protein